ncbi:MAG: hypothetical protein A2Y33_08305 [Spirochaetes bacterium GWF1_51_8]|nr:MAG: hypothetical protein A2Y33_08305 [Spirochaetes bacterium GWF1_51_8]
MFKGIGAKIRIAMLLTVSVSIAAVGVITYLNVREALFQSTKERMVSLLQILKESISAQFRMNSAVFTESLKTKILEEQKILSGAVSLNHGNIIQWEAVNQLTGGKMKLTLPEMYYQGTSLAKNDAFVDQLAKKMKSTVTVFQMIPDGMLRISTTVMKKDERAIGTFIPKESPVYQAILKGESFFGRAFVVDGWYITAYSPLRDPAGNLIGAIYAGVPEIDKSALRSLILSQKLGETGYLYIMDMNGALLIHPKIEGSNILNLPDENGKLFAQAMVKMSNGDLTYMWKNPGDPAAREKYVMFEFIPGLDWMIAGGPYTVELYSKADELGTLILIILAAAIAFSVAIAIIVARSIAKPVNAITGDISRASTSLNAAAGQISNSSQSLSSSASELSSSIEEMSSSLEELQAIIENSTGTLNEAGSRMEETNKSTDELSAGMLELSGNMKKIDENSRRIGVIIKAIDDIAFQTNILALNAAVEAARAGDAGRGFAVVADQVKSLAQKSADAAKETAGLIELAIESVEDGVKVNQKVFESQNKAKEYIAKAAALIRDVIVASREQLKGATQITAALTQITSVSNSTASSSEENASAGEELLAQAMRMKEIVIELDRVISGKERNFSEASEPPKLKLIEAKDWEK